MLDTDEVKQPRRRRAASRPAGAPEAVAADNTKTLENVAKVAPQTAGESVEIAGEKPTRRRTRRTQKAEVVEAAASSESATQTALIPTFMPPVADSEPKSTRRRTLKTDPTQVVFSGAVAEAKPTRTRRSRKVASETPETDLQDQISSSLAELEQETKPRKLRPDLAQPFAIHLPENPTTDQVLDGLASSIASASNDSDDDDDEPRRRRRKRGGRRRRNRDDEDAVVATEADEDDESQDSDPDQSGADVADDSDDTDAEATGGVRRRRRRRRRGEDAEDDVDESVDVVVRVRDRRKATAASDEVTDIEGSTRMEAKRQRRREGRSATRRRAPIITESEFLARRESVDRVMAIQQSDEYSQIAILEDGVLVEHYVDRSEAISLIGNIYLGKVQNILPSMEAAFVDIGRGRNAVLYAGEIDWDSYGAVGEDRKVEKVFKSGDPVLVQVTKDPVGAKGARLTSHISIPGRYIVYSPGGQLSGISRKLPEEERSRLKTILDELIGPDASVIVRTAAEGASEDDLIHDAKRLKAQWEVIQKKAKSGKAPQLLYSEPDLTVRIIRDLFTEDFNKLIVASQNGPESAFETVQGYVSHVTPHLADRLEEWDGDGEMFDHFRINEQLAKALERKVFLPSGGSLVIDRTEAMTVIDVNTGRFTGTKGNLEATVTSNNLEAAEEIVRQLRLRDIGGIIVIDFVDMVLPANRELLLRRLVECLGRDRTRHQVAEVTSLGLVQMTRKKIGAGLAEAFTEPCETCQGRGYHPHEKPIEKQVAADGGERGAKRKTAGGRRSEKSAKSDKVSGNGKSAKGDKSGGKSKAKSDNPEVAEADVKADAPKKAESRVRRSRSRKVVENN